MSEKSVRILLIEDEPSDVELVKRSLHTSPDAMELLVATSLGEGCERLGKGVDVVLCDLSLPDSTGVDTVSRLRDCTPETPILVLTGSETEAGACIEAGAHDYLTKSSLTPTTLRRALSYALERRRQAELRELRGALERYRKLSSEGTSTSTTRSLAGVRPLREREPEVFSAIQQSYRDLLEGYLDHLTVRDSRPRLQMESLANRLGDLGAGPRELVDVHMSALELAIPGTTGERAGSYAREGRLLALEMMGYLVDYYRAGVLRSRNGRSQA